MNPNITPARAHDFLNELIQLFVQHLDGTPKRGPLLWLVSRSFEGENQTPSLRVSFGRGYFSSHYEVSVALFVGGNEHRTSERVFILKKLTEQERKQFAQALAAAIKKLAYPDKDQRVDYCQVKPRWRGADHGVHRLRAQLEQLIESLQSSSTVAVRYDGEADQFILGETDGHGTFTHTTWSIQPRQGS